VPYYEFFWTPAIIAHLAEHGVTQDEFEEIVCDPDVNVQSRSTGENAVVLERFLSGEAELPSASIDRLVKFLDLKLVAAAR
jgi:hypothetical protein